MSGQSLGALVAETAASFDRAGLGAAALEARLLASCGGRVRVRSDIVSPSVEALMLLGRHGDYFPKDVEPLYVRPCDAVENLPSLAERMGMDAGEAVEELQDKLGRRPESAI